MRPQSLNRKRIHAVRLQRASARVGSGVLVQACVAAGGGKVGLGPGERGGVNSQLAPTMRYRTNTKNRPLEAR
jgi:hypothetical protein